MNQKRQYKTYTKAFKEEAVANTKSNIDTFILWGIRLFWDNEHNSSHSAPIPNFTMN
jgi:hypothetical protein